MRKNLLFLMLFTAFVAAQEGSVAQSTTEQKPLNRSGFYFDLSLGGVMRHLEADYKSYVDKQGAQYDYLGYTGKGGLLSARFGGIIRGSVAIYGNIGLEITNGKNSGYQKDTRPTASFFLSNGPGVTVFPFSHSTESIRNLYIGTTGNIILGGGGNIGFFGFNATFETGFLWNTSDRYYTGIAIGTDILSTIGFNSYDDEKGYSIWIGFKLIRK